MIRLFRHYVPRSLLLLALVEALILFVSIYLGKFWRVSAYDRVQPEIPDIFPTALSFTLVMLAIMTGMGLYERNFWNGKGDMILRVGVAFMLGLFIMTLIFYMFPLLYLGRGEFGLGFSLALLGVLLVRYCFLHISDRNILRRRILVLGTGYKAAQIEQIFDNPRKQEFNIIGYVLLPNGPSVVDPRKTLSIKTTLYALTEQYRIDEILIAMDDRRKGFPVEEILECKVSGVRIIDLPNFFERETGKIRLDALQPSTMIFSDGFHQAVLKTTSKRLFDIVASLLLLLITWPIMLLTALAIWIESGGHGPIFYLQERVGKNGRIFRLVKFRSMRVDAERDGVARWAQARDNRITRVGSLIRQTRIDELPQLFNVLLGQMSFVGPRPERPQFVTDLTKAIPFYALRHRVNPGITGWAQICYPYGASEEDAREKLQYDLYYIKNYSLFLDFMVLLQTVYTILWSKGAH